MAAAVESFDGTFGSCVAVKVVVVVLGAGWGLALAAEAQASPGGWAGHRAAIT